MGGYPPIIITDESKINEKTLESRGFATTNIVSINNIMDSKKKENLFIAFGSDDEDGVDFLVGGIFEENPHEYNDVEYNDIEYNDVLHKKIPTKLTKSKNK